MNSDKSIIVMDDNRYMRYEINPYRGNRYAIYEKNNGRPDSLLFCSHYKESAMIEWDRIKDIPVKRINHDLIF